MGFNPVLPMGLLPEGDVEGMKSFLAVLIRPELDRWMYIQWYLGAAIVALVGLLALVIVAQRLFTRSVWLLQFYSTPRGVFIVPNAVITFAIFIFVYAFLYVSYVFVNIEFHQKGSYAKAYMFLRGAPWMVIWVGCWFSTAGTMSAFPDALSFRGRVIGPVQQFLLKPAVFNTVLFSVPVLSTGTIYVPLIIGTRVFNRMLDRHQQWLIKAADPAANVAALTMEARSIWLEITRAYYYDSITFALYVTWDVFLLTCFFCIASHTLLRVRAQVKIAERKREALATTQHTFYLFSSRPSYGQARNMPLEPVAPPAPTTHSSRRSPQVIEVEQTATTSILFPALKVQPGEKLSRSEAVARRSKALKLVYRSLLIQYTAIGLGILSFIAMATLVAVTSYTAARTNRLRAFVQPHYLINCYINICYGCLIVGSVAWRSFDKAFILGGDVDDAEEVGFAVSSAVSDSRRDKFRSSQRESGVTSELRAWFADVVGPHTPEKSIRLQPSKDRLLAHDLPSPTEEGVGLEGNNKSAANKEVESEGTLSPRPVCHFADTPSPTASIRLSGIALTASQPSRFGAWRTSQG